MADKLFLVHGMGLQPAGWEKPLRNHLDALFKKYSRYDEGLDELFDVVPIQYDAVFRDLLTRWQNDTNALGAAEVPGSPLVGKLTGWLHDAGNDQNKLWMHPVDVLLYRFFPSVRTAVKLHVASQIMPVLQDLGASETWSVVAHSLGTAVTHDSLDMIWSGTLDDGSPTGMNERNRQAQAVVMVANTSRVLQTAARAYASRMQPGPAGKAGRGCLFYLTCFHHLDPCTWVQPFRPELWPDKAAVDRELYRFLETDHIHDWNIHDAVHYLKNPALFVPVLRALTMRTAVSKKTEQEALDQFKKFGSLKPDQVVAIKGWLEDKMPPGSDWGALIELAEWFLSPPASVTGP
jgi:hypothetical protein